MSFHQIGKMLFASKSLASHLWWSLFSQEPNEIWREKKGREGGRRAAYYYKKKNKVCTFMLDQDKTAKSRISQEESYFSVKDGMHQREGTKHKTSKPSDSQRHTRYIIDHVRSQSATPLPVLAVQRL